MERSTVRIGILTSSRADYGYYKPLIKAFQNNQFVKVNVIAFGTHLSEMHGLSKSEIIKDGFEINYEIHTFLGGDSPREISFSFGESIKLFSDFWERNQFEFDWVLALGDRYEMAAAVISSVPFQLNFAHLYAGETTEGAIDDIYRHQISLVSKKHFVSLPSYKKKVQELVGKEGDIEIIGNLSLHNLIDIEFLSLDEFYNLWKIDLNKPTILITFHPETVNFKANFEYSNTVFDALTYLTQFYQLVITMPNADTNASFYRTVFESLRKEHKNVYLIENFGTQSYFTCMKYSKCILGNSSSGIVEAATFGKFVVNVGDRQKGRFAHENVLHVPFDSNLICRAVESVSDKSFNKENPFFKENAIELIVNSFLVK
jgi:GDP/UDP-N,N'-diacetylbacillosamine 2-epimerase (hydrolysing)